MTTLKCSRAMSGVATGTAALITCTPCDGALRGRVCGLAGPAAEAAVTRAGPLVVVQRHRRDRLALDVLPDVQLGPVEQRVDTHVRAGREVGLELIPELGRLVADVPVVVLVTRREVALLG